MGAKTLGDNGPAHQLRDGEDLEELLLMGNEGIASLGVDAVEEVGLFVIVRGEKDVVNYSLEDLRYVNDSVPGMQ